MELDEQIFMGLHVIDVLQTINHGKDPCYKEVDPVTKRIIGTHPSKEKVIAWGIGSAIVEHYAYQFVDNSNLPKWVKSTYSASKLFIKADVVHSNYQLGINLYGNNDHARSGEQYMIDCAARYNL